MVGSVTKTSDSHIHIRIYISCPPRFSHLNHSITSFFESRATKFTKEQWLVKYTTRPAEPAWFEQLPGSRGPVDAGIHPDVRISSTSVDGCNLPI